MLGARKLLTLTHKCTSFDRILLLPSFVLALDPFLCLLLSHCLFIHLNIYAHLLFTILICRKHRNLYAQTSPN